MRASIRTSAPARHAAMLGIGVYRPRLVVDNDEVAGLIDSSDEWIRTRSGIERRRWAGEDETIVEMATAAAAMAIERSGVDPAGIGCVLLATISNLKQTPAAASEVATRVGAVNAGAMDISAACAGFCYGLALAGDIVRGGSAETVLVIGVERMTDLIDHRDRGTAFLFADGAGAAVVGRSEEPGIGPVVWGSDGTQGELISQDHSWLDWRDQLAKDPSTEAPALRMNGQPVFRWATVEMAKVARRTLEAAGVDVADLGAFIPHQANDRITQALAKSLRLPPTVAVARDVVEQGNTSAASVPLAMEALLSSGEARSGDTALLLGFGAGLSFAGQVVVLP
ncbi:beta-ketoacyl-ACP synthase III [Kutzneria sp. CA-103260]|uniref:beta-ketoacyl-ACP synthase III n=1 Tax=Kutzneria sp. CA-103260 TaxID=2802641 RepID=UPI001BEE28EA|nr:beta-ketoacyl-ACP synthase III [Kutzneria sp. CA-103260]QUQ63323.1 ketoacyl-ACP synthase III [Kutzneria sp. CA-103260]